MSAATLPLRLARREVRRRPGRTLLVALLVALPVAGMAGAVTLIRTDRISPGHEWTYSNGTADAVLYPTGDDPPVPPVALPAGSRTLAVAQAYARVRTADLLHRSNLEVTDQSLMDPLATGILTLRDGRAPTAAGEIALAPHAARDLGVGLGGTLRLDRPAGSLRVVGFVEQPSCLSCPTALVAPGQIGAVAPVGANILTLVDLPAGLTAPQLEALAAQPGIRLRSDVGADGARDGSRDEGVRWSLVIGAVVLMVMGIVISAAFAVGARRQLVTLGQLSAGGASPAVLKGSLVLQGTLTGAIGVVGGLALSSAVLLVGRSRIEGFLGHRFDHFVVRPVDYAVVVLLGLGASTLAALIPARTAAQVPTLAALAGRRPLAPVPRRLVASGFAAVLVGLALLSLAVIGSNDGGGSGNVWALVAITGGVSELLGACAIAPAVVARLEPLAGRVRGSWRIAARGLARNRTRTGAVVSAVAAAGALAIVSTALVRGNHAQEVNELGVSNDVVVAGQVTSHVIPNDPNGGVTITRAVPGASELDALAAALPSAQRATVRTAALPVEDLGDGGQVSWSVTAGPPIQGSLVTTDFDEAVVADPAVLDAAEISDAGRSHLERDGWALLQLHGQSRVDLTASDGTVRRIHAVAARHSVGRATLLVTEPEAARLHLTVAPSAVLYRSPHALTGAQRDLVEDIQLDRSSEGTVGDDYVYADVTWFEPSTGPTTLQLELLLTGLALVFSLFVVGASLALAAAESKDERDILTIVGAPPAALARAAGARAWLLSGIGGLLAVPIGFLPVVVYARASADHFPLVFPGRTVVVLLLGVPTVVGLVALAGSATAQRLRPVRVSTATFE